MSTPMCSRFLSTSFVMSLIGASYLDCAAVCAHDFPDDGQPETVAVRRGGVVGCETGALVGDGQFGHPLVELRPLDRDGCLPR